MILKPLFHASEDVMAECHLIASYAYERFIQVEPWQVGLYLAQWRMWYYHMITDSAVLSLPGARRIPPSGR